MNPGISVSEGFDYGLCAPGKARPNSPFLREVRVRHNGVVRPVWVLDRPHRPPHPEGVWLDDLVTTACRRLFGSAAGSARLVPGESDLMEFRDRWENPLASKVRVRVPVLVHPPGSTEIAVIECAAVPGAEEAAVIFAAVDALCRRKFGTGRLSTAGESKFRFDRGPDGPEPVIPCRYTVIHAGTAHEILVSPRRTTLAWDAVLYAVSKECSRKFGPGKISWEPDLGETYLSWA